MALSPRFEHMVDPCHLDVDEAPAPEPLNPGLSIAIVDERRAEDPAALTMTIAYGPDGGSLEGLNAAMEGSVPAECEMTP